MPKGVFLYDARRTGRFRVLIVEGCRAYHCGIIYKGKKAGNNTGGGKGKDYVVG